MISQQLLTIQVNIERCLGSLVSFLKKTVSVAKIIKPITTPFSLHRMAHIPKIKHKKNGNK